MSPNQDAGKSPVVLRIELQNVNEGQQWTAHSNLSQCIAVGQTDPFEALRLALVEVGVQAVPKFQTVTLPTVPRVTDPEAVVAIERELELRGFPASPQNAARAGYEASRKIAEVGRTMTLLAHGRTAPEDLEGFDKFWVRQHTLARSAEIAMRRDVDMLLADRARGVELLQEVDALLAEAGLDVHHAARVKIAKGVNPHHRTDNAFPHVEPDPAPIQVKINEADAKIGRKAMPPWPEIAMEAEGPWDHSGYVDNPSVPYLTQLFPFENHEDYGLVEGSVTHQITQTGQPMLKAFHHWRESAWSRMPVWVSPMPRVDSQPHLLMVGFDNQPQYPYASIVLMDGGECSGVVAEVGTALWQALVHKRFKRGVNAPEKSTAETPPPMRPVSELCSLTAHRLGIFRNNLIQLVGPENREMVEERTAELGLYLDQIWEQSRVKK